jgi:DNA primase
MSAQMLPAGVSNVLSRLVCKVLSLRLEHAARLLARGLGPGEVERGRYVSVPATAADRQRAADELAPYLDATGGGVPGFYRERGRWRMVYRPPGFFIPVRDACGHIQALSQRVDDPRDGAKYLWLSSADRDGGASSGTPPHFAGRQHLFPATEVTITEGALKADIAAHLLGSPVIGVAGTHATRGLAERLRTGLPLVRRVLVAFDRDMMEKPQVLDAALGLCGQLEAEGFGVKVRTWPGPEKGIDDYLLAQLSSRKVAA